MMIEGRNKLPPLPGGERVARAKPEPGEGASDPAKRRPGATARARSLRRNDTEPEYRLWGELRNRRLNGYKFARQIPIGPYVVDFLNREIRLVVELDGAQHADGRRDAVRDRYLSGNGYAVLRFWNDEVLKERRAVLETILAALEGRLAPSPGLRFAPATLSPRGEEDGAAPRRRARGYSSAARSENHAVLASTEDADGAALPPLPGGERVARAKPEPGEGAGTDRAAGRVPVPRAGRGGRNR